ncbi:hypothetical protein ACF0H5_022033 [Mactra antiquata]
MVSVSGNIDQLYSKADTSKTSSDIDRGLDNMNGRQNDTDALLQQLRDSKESAIKAANDFRMEMEQLLKQLEEVSIEMTEYQYKKLEKQIFEGRKNNEVSIDARENLKQLLVQASGNIAQQFVCSKLAQQLIKTIKTDEIASSDFCHAEVTLQPSEELKTSIESKTSLGQASAVLSRIDDLYKVTKIHDMNVKLQDDSEDCFILGSCIIDNTVLFTDCLNDKLKRFDISSSSLIDCCTLPDGPRGVCRVGEEVAVAYPDVRPNGVCVDCYGNVIVANYDLHTVVQCVRVEQKRGIHVDETKCNENLRSVCINPRLKRCL